LAEKYLLTGQLVEGEKTLQRHLREKKADDQARFGLGIIQFLRAFEQLGGTLYRHGLRTGDTSIILPPRLAQMFKTNPRPEKLTYPGLRKMCATFIEDLNKAEATLALIKDDTVKLPLHVALVKMHILGQKEPINAAFLLGQFERGDPEKLKKLVVGL
jgi:hypothetical protein